MRVHQQRHVEISIALLREYEPKDGYYGADSGGKDSCVIKHLARVSGVKVDWHYNVTTCDPPELVRFIRREHPDTKFERPEHGKTIFTRIEEIGFPSRKARWCCKEFKERGGSGRWVITGVRDAESAGRKKRKQVEACFKDSRKWYVHPIKHWTDEQVWAYIRAEQIPYCSLYDEGFSRLGCVICPFKRDVEQSMKRWPGIWRLCRRALQRRFPKSQSLQDRFESGDALFNWWISRDSPYPPPRPGTPTWRKREAAELRFQEDMEALVGTEDE